MSTETVYMKWYWRYFECEFVSLSRNLFITSIFYGLYVVWWIVWYKYFRR